MWFATIDGVQVCLEVKGEANEESAAAALRVLLAAAKAGQGGSPQARAAPEPSAPTVAGVVPAFLGAWRKKVKPRTWENYRPPLEDLARAFGPRALSSLTADEVEEWARRPAWSNSTRNTYLVTVATMLRWAGHPLKLRPPPKESRGADVALSDEQFAKVIEVAQVGRHGGDFRQLLKALRETGARPAEVAMLTVAAVDWPNRCVRLKQHKTAHRGHGRVIHLSDAALAVFEQQRAKYGSGLLFRTRTGRPWHRQALVLRCLKLSKKVGFRVIAYGTRHSFATRALEKGVPDTVVAALLGHSTTAMIHKHYAHVGENSRVLRDALAKLARPA